MFQSPDFVIGLSVLARGSLQEKLRWAFSLYDINGDGFITKEEMGRIVSSVYDMMGKSVEPLIDDATARDHVDRVFQRLDQNRDGIVTMEEFLESCSRGMSPTLHYRTKEMSLKLHYRTKEMSPTLHYRTKEMSLKLHYRTKEMSPTLHYRTKEMSLKLHYRTKETSPTLHSRTKEMSPSLHSRTKEMSPTLHSRTKETAPTLHYRTKEMFLTLHYIL
ncbi:KCNIP4 [Cordylochernes scorpioides]|uniref:KCNIP4 n=1 Tax=Cordylochernes scorpioides TaxID=51811 RepID=A0ABY6KV01_9ARAC|nr:KCNIP4 [Cordylochernes scorpioides]